MNITLHNYIPLVAGLICVILSVIVYRKEAAFGVNRRFSYLCLGIAIWDLGFFAQNLPGLEKANAMFWIKVSHFGAALAIPLGLHFIIRFSRSTERIFMRLLCISYAASAIIVSVLFTTPLIILDVKSYVYGNHEVWGVLYPIYFLNIVFSYGLMLFVLMRAIRKTTSNIEFNRIRYIFYGTLIVVCTTMTNFLPAFGFDFFGLGHFGILIFMVMVFISIYRYRLMNVRLALAKYLLLAVFWLLMCAVYSGIIYLLGLLYPPERIAENRLLFNFVVAGIFVLVLQFGLARILPWIEKTVYPLKSDLKTLMETLELAIARASSAPQVAEALLAVTFGSLKVPAALVYLRRPGSGRYVLVDAQGMDRGRAPAGLSPQFRLTRCRETVVRDEARRDAEVENYEKHSAVELLRIVHELDTLGMEVAIPLATEQEHFGILAFGKKRFRGVYDMEDIKALSLLAGRAVNAIVTIESAHRLKERENLALIGEMTAGIAHEIKNPLGVIKGAAESLGHSPGEGNRFVRMISEESGRLDRTLRQFLGFARPSEPALEQCDAAALAARCRELFLSEAKSSAFSINIRSGTGPVFVNADPDYFKQIFYNLAGNSLEARADGTFNITVKDASDGVNVRFADNCGGMPDEVYEKAFVPFFTTKPTGTGLGLAMVKKLALLMDGNIYIKNRPGEGTEFVLTLARGLS